MRTYIVTFHRSYHIGENMLRETENIDNMDDSEIEEFAEEKAVQLLSEDTNTTISDIYNVYSSDVETRQGNTIQPSPHEAMEID